MALTYLSHSSDCGRSWKYGFRCSRHRDRQCLGRRRIRICEPLLQPALAPYLTDQSLGISAALLTQDRQLQFIELRTPLKPLAGIAAGLIHAGVSKIDQRDLSGYHTGMLSTNEYAFFAAFGLRVGQFTSIGIGCSFSGTICIKTFLLCKPLAWTSA